MARYITETPDIHGVREQIKANLIALGIEREDINSKANIVVASRGNLEAYMAYVFINTENGDQRMIIKASACTTVAEALERLLEGTTEMCAIRFGWDHETFDQQPSTMVGDGVFVMDDVLEMLTGRAQKHTDEAGAEAKAATEVNGATNGAANMEDVEMVAVGAVLGDGGFHADVVDDGVGDETVTHPPHVAMSGVAVEEDDGTRTPAKTPRGLFSDDDE